MKTLAEFVRSTPFWVIAHRGASGDAPENTMAAISQAIDEGARMIEIDIQATRDDEIVVFHDHVLGRTTNGSGHIRQTSYDDLKQLDAGGWFDARFAGERIPRLDEVLDLIQGKAYLNLEIKPLKDDPHAERLITQAMNIIQEHDMENYTVYASFDHHALKLVKEIDPLARTAALNVPGDSRLPSEVVSSCGADAYGCSIHELTRKRSDDVRAHRIPWGIYTVNTPEQLAKALEYGVQSVVSNKPGLIWHTYSALTQPPAI